VTVGLGEDLEQKAPLRRATTSGGRGRHRQIDCRGPKPPIAGLKLDPEAFFLVA
jgi:hypothetical protein